MNELKRHLSYLNAHRHDFDALLKKLINWRLINLSNSDFEASARTMIGISAIGRYYINELIQYPEYLYKLIFDVPLPHAAWKKGERDSYRVRVQSMYEYVSEVAAVENEELEIIAQRSEYAYTAKVLSDRTLLSRQVINSAQKINCAAARSRTHPATAELAGTWVETFKKKEREIERMETALSTYCANMFKNEFGPSRTEEVIQVTDEKSEFVVRVPKLIAPGRQNKCHLTANLSAYAELMPLHSQVVGLWSSLAGPMQFKKLVPFARCSNAHEYEAEVSFEDVVEARPFPISQLMLFCGPEILRIASIA